MMNSSESRASWTSGHTFGGAMAAGRSSGGAVRGQEELLVVVWGAQTITPVLMPSQRRGPSAPSSLGHTPSVGFTGQSNAAIQCPMLIAPHN